MSSYCFEERLDQGIVATEKRYRVSNQASGRMRLVSARVLKAGRPSRAGKPQRHQCAGLERLSEGSDRSGMANVTPDSRLRVVTRLERSRDESQRATSRANRSRERNGWRSDEVS